MKFSKIAENINESGTMSFFSLVQKLKQSGENIISLATGELSINSPDSVKQAGIKAIENNQTRYITNNGLLELRLKICKYINDENNTSYTPEQILLSTGAKQALFNALFSICSEPDEIIIFSPYYPSYPEQIKLCGGRSVVIKLSPENNYQIESKPIIDRINSNTKAIIINSPANPTGAILDKNSLAIIKKIVIENNLWLIADEIYDKIIFPPATFNSILQKSEDIKNNLILINGFSKSFAMTGWRLGYCVGPKELITRANLIQSHLTSNACTISQYAALEALNDKSDFTVRICEDLKRKKDIAYEILSGFQNLKIFNPEGAFYFFLDIRELDGSQNNINFANSVKIAEYLLSEQKVAVVPGEAFGTPGFLRISFATKSSELELGCKKIVEGFNNLTG